MMNKKNAIMNNPLIGTRISLCMFIKQSTIYNRQSEVYSLQSTVGKLLIED